MTLAAIFAIVAAGCFVTHLLLCWYPEDAVELHTIWAVQGTVYWREDNQYGIGVWNEEFTAPNRAEAARQFFEFARSHGRWVRRVTEIRPVDVVAVTHRKART